VNKVEIVSAKWKNYECGVTYSIVSFITRTMNIRQLARKPLAEYKEMKLWKRKYLSLSVYPWRHMQFHLHWRTAWCLSFDIVVPLDNLNVYQSATIVSSFNTRHIFTRDCLRPRIHNGPPAGISLWSIRVFTFELHTEYLGYAVVVLPTTRWRSWFLLLVFA
jgi:hypothetical protein